jgi:hypothetical protein
MNLKLLTYLISDSDFYLIFFFVVFFFFFFWGWGGGGGGGGCVFCTQPNISSLSIFHLSADQQDIGDARFACPTFISLPAI